jgi:predicted double-glycine peptidase
MLMCGVAQAMPQDMQQNMQDDQSEADGYARTEDYAESDEYEEPEDYAEPEESDESAKSIEEALAESAMHEKPDEGLATVINGTHESLDVRVVSWRDLPFKTVKRQTFDYSCGSAAVATLLTYVYGRQTTESEVFKDMFESGDKEKIRREGFSLLDMRNYLRRRGYNAAGVKINYKAIEKHKIPFIALINRDGYMHFVVVKSVAGSMVLIGDPSKGNVITSREDFMAMWNGVSLIVTNQARAARGFFADRAEWSYAHPVVSTNASERPGIDSVNVPFQNWQIAPTGLNVLSSMNEVTSSLTSN